MKRPPEDSLAAQLAAVGVSSELCSSKAYRAGSGMPVVPEEPTDKDGKPAGDIDQGATGRDDSKPDGEFRSADRAAVAAELRRLGVR